MPAQAKYTKLLAIVLVAIVLTALIGIGFWLLLRFHRKKLLEGNEEENEDVPKKGRHALEAAKEAAMLAQEKLDKFNRKIHLKKMQQQHSQIEDIVSPTNKKKHGAKNWNQTASQDYLHKKKQDSGEIAQELERQDWDEDFKGKSPTNHQHKKRSGKGKKKKKVKKQSHLQTQETLSAMSINEYGEESYSQSSDESPPHRKISSGTQSSNQSMLITTYKTTTTIKQNRVYPSSIPRTTAVVEQIDEENEGEENTYRGSSVPRTNIYNTAGSQRVSMAPTVESGDQLKINEKLQKLTEQQLQYMSKLQQKRTRNSDQSQLDISINVHQRNSDMLGTTTTRASDEYYQSKSRLNRTSINESRQKQQQ